MVASTGDKEKLNNPDFAPAVRFLQARMGHTSVQIFVPESRHVIGLPRVLLRLARTNIRGASYVIDLSAMSTEELSLFKEVMDIALGMATPIAAEYDKHTAENKEALSEDINSRLYRPVPIVLFGTRALGKYSARLFGGYTDALRRLGFNFGDS